MDPAGCAARRTPPHRSLERFVGIPFTHKDYLELVDWPGRIIRQAKRGYIQANFQRLSLEQDTWRTLTIEFEDRFNNWVGSERIAM